VIEYFVFGLLKIGGAASGFVVGFLGTSVCNANFADEHTFKGKNLRGISPKNNKTDVLECSWRIRMHIAVPHKSRYKLLGSNVAV